MIRFLVLAALLWAGCPTAAETLPAEAFIYPGLPRGGLNTDYIWRVLRAALDHSRAAYGPYRLEAALSPPDRRQVRALSRGEPPLTVGAFTASASLARELVPVRIPLERGLLGYRVLLVRRANLAAFEQVTAVDGLKPFSFGLMPPIVACRAGLWCHAAWAGAPSKSAREGYAGRVPQGDGGFFSGAGPVRYGHGRF